MVRRWKGKIISSRRRREVFFPRSISFVYIIGSTFFAPEPKFKKFVRHPSMSIKRAGKFTAANAENLFYHLKDFPPGSDV